MRTFVMCAALAVASVWLVPTASAQVRDVEITGGKVSGLVANGIASFKGIHFAAPPVGPLRWKAPQPVTPWSGVKQASVPISEDGLYLNVWTPAKTAGDRLPVMVWIYDTCDAPGA